MTTKELFEELRTIPSGLGCIDAGCEGCAYEEKERERIEKELEASIRKEVVLSLLERLSVLDVREPLPKHLTALDIHGWANEQGITLN